MQNREAQQSSSPVYHKNERRWGWERRRNSTKWRDRYSVSVICITSTGSLTNKPAVDLPFITSTVVANPLFWYRLLFPHTRLLPDICINSEHVRDGTTSSPSAPYAHLPIFLSQRVSVIGSDLQKKKFQTLWHLRSAYTSLSWLIQNSSCSNNPLFSKHLCSSFTIFYWHANEQPQVWMFNFFCSPFFQILIGLERYDILWFFSSLNVFFMLLIIHILEKGGKKPNYSQPC